MYAQHPDVNAPLATSFHYHPGTGIVIASDQTAETAKRVVWSGAPLVNRPLLCRVSEALPLSHIVLCYLVIV